MPMTACRDPLPASADEMRSRGWDRPDIVLVTGDAHVDHPAFPAAILGRALEAEGFRVGVLSRPDPGDPAAIARLGPPRLFFGVTAGTLDSIVANYTALGRRRNDDPHAPDGRAGGRPDRAVTVYCNLIRRAFGKETIVVAGGLEASLRRFAHYDFLTGRIRRPLLMDCGADVLVHGMGEVPAAAIARALDRLDADGIRPDERQHELRTIPGVVWREPLSAGQPPAGAVELPSFEQVEADPRAFAGAHHLFETTRHLTQTQACSGWRVVANAPDPGPDEAGLDRLYRLPFSRDPHPGYGGVPIAALEQVRFSIAAHRGCAGGCAFCAIGVHQGRRIASRSREGILDEVRRLTGHPDFRGTVNDIGGPSANMYRLRCNGPTDCRRVSCLWPGRCRHLRGDQTEWLSLLDLASRLPDVSHLFVTTGIRTDLIDGDLQAVGQLAGRFTAGLLKAAPEHVSVRVLGLMRKPEIGSFDRFLAAYRSEAGKAGIERHVLPYLMAAHPGCRLEDMLEVALWMRRHGLRAEQCQIFTPTPGTASTAMYATGLDPATLEPVFVERDPRMKRLQKGLILWHDPDSRPLVREALRLLDRPELEKELARPARVGRRSSGNRRRDR